MVVCCCLQTYNLKVTLERMGLVLGQSWMVVPINRRILFCSPIIIYYEVCCCLHIHSVINMLVMGSVLGQSLMFMYYGSALLLLTHKIHCLPTYEHMSALLAIKANMFVKFHKHIY